MNQPICGKCGGIMTPKNAKLHPEFFLHDTCLPPEVAMANLLGLLIANGYKTVEGRDAVLAAIAAEADGSSEVLCSGYRVFHDGTKCAGCRDCSPNETESTTDEEKRVKIAEACGWTNVGKVLGTPPGWTNGTVVGLPDYLNDLNAMHEAEKALTHEQCITYHEEIDRRRFEDFGPEGEGREYPAQDFWFHSTASQRAEAFLAVSLGGGGGVSVGTDAPTTEAKDNAPVSDRRKEASDV